MAKVEISVLVPLCVNTVVFHAVLFSDERLTKYFQFPNQNYKNVHPAFNATSGYCRETNKICIHITCLSEISIAATIIIMSSQPGTVPGGLRSS